MIRREEHEILRITAVAVALSTFLEMLVAF